MDNLLRQLESLKLTGDLDNESLWQSCMRLVENSLVPLKDIGRERPCEEKDFREYRQIVNRNLKNIETTLRHVSSMHNVRRNRYVFQNPYVRDFVVYLILIIGEQSEKNVWNTAESVSIADSLKTLLCDFTRCKHLSRLLNDHAGGDSSLLNTVLLSLRPKLLRDTWKAYPAAVQTYKWILWLVQEPHLANHINAVIPTALLILDDYVADNRLLGLKCIEKILQHCHMKKELIETGYSEVIYDTLNRLLSLREVAYVVPLYACMARLLSTTEYYNKTNCLEWTRRDDVLSSLLGHMECEQNLELRHAYMYSLPGLLTNIGCAKWCERLSRILSEYCEHHTDLKTLKVTTETAKKFLVTFEPRVAPHCVSLYAAFLKLHMDLTETPVFDKEILMNLEDCLSLLYKLTPSIGKKIINDHRMNSVMQQQLQFQMWNDNTYFE